MDNLTNMPPVTLIHNDTFCLREELAAYVRCVPTAFIQHDTQLDNRSVPIVHSEVVYLESSICASVLL